MLGVRKSRRLKHNQTAAASDPINKKKLCAELFTYDLIVEILSWLPPKFAGRCKVVCKLWRAIIQSRHFIEQHMRRQDDILVYFPPARLLTDQQPFKAIFCLRGLLLEQNVISKRTLRVRNYATNQVFELPELSESLISGSMFYLRTSDEYKVLNLHWKENDTNIGLKVLTKGTDVTWRCVEIPLPLSFSKSSDQNIRLATIGSVGYIMIFSESGSKMMAFQIEDESFVEVLLPLRVKFCATGSRIYPMVWDSDVSIGCFVGKELHIWVLQDYKTSKWDERKIVFPSALLQKRPPITRLQPLSVVDSEILVLIRPEHKRMLEVNYNIKTKATRTNMFHRPVRPSLVRL